MFNFNVLLATVLVTAAVVVADGPTIGTPASLTQCQPVLLSWQNAQGEGKHPPMSRQSDPQVDIASIDTDAL